MRFLGFFLLLAGWLLTLAAIVLLAQPIPRTFFVLGGLGVEVGGLGLVAYSHMAARRQGRHLSRDEV
jgi:hypothetical protein